MGMPTACREQISESPLPRSLPIVTRSRDPPPPSPRASVLPLCSSRHPSAAMAARPVTPPPPAAALPGAALPLTPEAKRQIEENRLRAKARIQGLQQHQQQQGGASNAYNKRPLEVVPADSTSPTAPNVRTFSHIGGPAPSPAGAALQNAVAGPSRAKGTYGADDPNKPLPNMIGKFVDYDLSTLKNSKGGFLVDEEMDDERALRERRQVEELKKQRQRQAQRLAQDPGRLRRIVSLDVVAHASAQLLFSNTRPIRGARSATPSSSTFSSSRSLASASAPSARWSTRTGSACSPRPNARRTTS